MMLEKPNLKDEKLISCLQSDYGLSVQTISFLPIGADENTAVYRVRADYGRDYFAKLRKGDMDYLVVAVPEYLREQGISQIIPTLKTQQGQMWANLGSYKVILHPFVEGQNGYVEIMSEQQWVEFGSALKQIHEVNLPSEIMNGIRRETFSPRFRKLVQTYLTEIDHETYEDAVAKDMAIFLQSKCDEIFELVNRAEKLALILEDQSLEYVVCHGDIHGWNLLIDANGSLYIVDWDTLICAPKERDLMFVGGGIGNSKYSPKQEEAMFYQGYGQTNINQFSISYYRYERIIEDIAVFCEQIFSSDEGGDDRKQSFNYLKSNFLSNSTIEVAKKLDRSNVNYLK